MHTPFASLTASELATKRKWYAARQGFDTTIADIDAALELRNVEALGGVSAPDLDLTPFDALIQITVDLADEPSPSSRSVVRDSYKKRYAERGDPRSCGDWLAKLLIARCNDDERKLNVPRFEAILTENGVKHEHWNRTTAGWQGRLRMTGRMALQKQVVLANALIIDGETIEPPFSWIVAHGG